MDKDIILLLIKYSDKEIDDLLQIRTGDLKDFEVDFEVDMVKSEIERLERMRDSIVEAKEVLNYKLSDNKWYGDNKRINCLIECERIDGSVYCSYHSFDFDEKKYNRIMRKLKLKRVKGE